MGKEVLTKENEEKLKKLLDSYVALMKVIVKKAFQTIKSLVFILLQYALLIWIYLSIYDRLGFERAVLIAIVGVIVVASRSNQGRN